MSNNLFPDTIWNRYVQIINKHVIELDSDKNKQFCYVMEAHSHMLDCPAFDREAITSWYKSQMMLTGHHEFCNAFDFAALYSQPVISLDNMLSQMMPDTEKYNELKDYITKQKAEKKAKLIKFFDEDKFLSKDEIDMFNRDYVDNFEFKI